MSCSGEKMGNPKVSIIFRALNEAKWFNQALEACRTQDTEDKFEFEILLVDSGSTDATMDIGKNHGVRILHIKKTEFTFGRSLNIGCDAANGEILVFISAHCIPEHRHWLVNLVSPILDGTCDYAYGRQVGHETESRFSEKEVFAHYFGPESDLPQEGFFCNNANAAVRATRWAEHRFDETVTGLEDMVLAKSITESGGKVGYVADAPVVHIHEEDFRQTYRRYYREALVLRDIMPRVQFNLLDFLKCTSAGILHDLATARRLRKLGNEWRGIVGFRFMQYWGTYRGHNEHRILSRAEKEKYYYPRVRQRYRSRVSQSKIEPAE